MHARHQRRRHNQMVTWSQRIQQNQTETENAQSRLARADAKGVDGWEGAHADLESPLRTRLVWDQPALGSQAPLFRPCLGAE